MAQTYTLSVASDFGGSLNSTHLGQFVDHINNDGGIAATMLSVSEYTGDVVSCTFDGTLSSPEQTTLGNLAGTFSVPDAEQYDNIIKLDVRSTKIMTTDYERISSFVYPGSNHINTIQKIIAVSYKDSGTTNYSIKAFDKDNSNTVVENTFTNTSEQINTLTPLSNIPTEECIIEIHAKQTGGGSNDGFHIESVTIFI